MPRFHLLSKVVSQEATNDLSGSLLHIAGGVRIGVESEAGFCVAKDTCQCFGIYTGGKGVRCEGVPDIMKSDVGQSRFF